MPDPSPPKPVVYWRPGCPFCHRLLDGVARADLDVELRNIWEDEEAAAYVRSVARGHETVPTAVIGDRVMVNPALHELVSAARDAGCAA